MPFFYTLFFFLFFIPASYAKSTSFNHYFDSLRQDPSALYALLYEMPKGGELHYHLAGGAYPETMLDVAAQHNYCIHKNTFAISQDTSCTDGIKSKDLMENPAFYQKIIRAWSMKDFIPGQESGHDHFFKSFLKFMPIIEHHSPELLANIMKRAAEQHELYIELMIMPDNAQSTSFAPKQLPVDLKAFTLNLLKNKAFLKRVDQTVLETEQLLEGAKQALGCNQNPEQAVCKLSVKFQYYVLREQPSTHVFVQALHGFLAISRSAHLVGINLVQPEDGLMALQDYSAQMSLFDFLHQMYPNVQIALHAGELAFNAVAPEVLRFHIREALQLGHARRIGHGADIAFEANSDALLKTMAAKEIAVEVNLTSNQAILNLSGKKHPLRYYLNHQVPVVLSTDDEGILRTNLTQEYAKAVLEHHLDYNTLKSLNRNSLTYSFLPGKSLWASARKGIPVEECQSLKSPSCLAFIKSNTKAKLQWQLEQQLTEFESRAINNKE